MVGIKCYVGDAFGVPENDEEHRDNLNSMSAVGRTATKSGMEGLCHDMLAAGIDLRGRLIIGDGTQTLVGPTASCNYPPDEAGVVRPRDVSVPVKEAFTRVEEIETHYDPTAIRPVAHHVFTHPRKTEDQEEIKHAPKNDDGEHVLPGTYHVYVMPAVPDLQDFRPVEMEDVYLTLQVMKATGALPKLWDCQRANFVFIKDDEGNVVSYPDDCPPEFRGKPIAFFRDLNGLAAEFGKDGLGTVGSALEARFGPDSENERFVPEEFKNIPSPPRELRKNKVEWKKAKKQEAQAYFDALPIAPESCIKACEQQYHLAAKTAEAIRDAGITPNVEIPPLGPKYSSPNKLVPTEQEEVVATEVGQTQGQGHTTGMQ